MRSYFLTRQDRGVGAGIFDSIEWVFQTHLKEDDTGEYNYAMLTGINEDSPHKIELWRDEPNFDTPADKIWYYDVKLKQCEIN